MPSPIVTTTEIDRTSEIERSTYAEEKHRNLLDNSVYCGRCRHAQFAFGLGDDRKSLMISAIMITRRDFQRVSTLATT